MPDLPTQFLNYSGFVGKHHSRFGRQVKMEQEDRYKKRQEAESAREEERARMLQNADERIDHAAEKIECMQIHH